MKLFEKALVAMDHDKKFHFSTFVGTVYHSHISFICQSAHLFCRLGTKNQTSYRAGLVGHKFSVRVSKLTLKTPLPGQESGSTPRRHTTLQISQRWVETDWVRSSPFHLIAANPLPHPRLQDHLLQNNAPLPSGLFVQTLQWLFDMTLLWT